MPEPDRARLMNPDTNPGDLVALDLIAAAMKPLDLGKVRQSAQEVFNLWGESPMTDSIESAVVVLIVIDQVLKIHRRSATGTDPAGAR